MKAVSKIPAISARGAASSKGRQALAHNPATRQAGDVGFRPPRPAHPRPRTTQLTVTSFRTLILDSCSHNLDFIFPDFSS